MRNGLLLRPRIIIIMRAAVGVNTVMAIFDRKLAHTARRTLALTARTSVLGKR